MAVAEFGGTACTLEGVEDRLPRATLIPAPNHAGKAGWADCLLGGAWGNDLTQACVMQGVCVELTCVHRGNVV